MMACPICGGSSSPVGERRGFPFHRCRECKLLFAWPTLECTAGIYSEDYFTAAKHGHGYVDYDRDKQAMIPTFDKYLRILDVLVPEKGSLLDVGSATGFFLEIARAAGWQVAGVDISQYATERARQKGFDVRCGTLEQYQAGRQFDVITMWDVLEHLLKPERVIRCAYAALRPGGVLALNTPDSGSILSRILGLRWHMVVPPEHLILFHRRSMRMLLERTGFSDVHCTCIGKRFTLQYIFRTLASWQKLPVWTAAADRLQKSALGEIGAPLNLYDNMFVTARKV